MNDRQHDFVSDELADLVSRLEAGRLELTDFLFAAETCLLRLPPDSDTYRALHDRWAAMEEDVAFAASEGRTRLTDEEDARVRAAYGSMADLINAAKPSSAVAASGVRP